MFLRLLGIRGLSAPHSYFTQPNVERDKISLGCLFTKMLALRLLCKLIKSKHDNRRRRM